MKVIEMPEIPIMFSGLDEALEKLERIKRISNSISPICSTFEDYLYTVSEVAKILRMNTNSVYQLINSGHLKALKLGKLKVRKTELEKFLDHASSLDLLDE